MGQIGHFKKYVAYVLATFAGVILLTSCSSTPKTTSVPQVTHVKPDTPAETQKITPEHKLLEAKRVWQQFRNKAQRDTLLLDAVEMYIEQDEPLLAQQILYEMKQDGVAKPLTDRYTLLVVQAYQNDGSASPSQLLSLLERTPMAPEYQVQKAQLQTSLYAKQRLWAQAANSILKTQIDDEQKISQVWQWLMQLPLDEIERANTQYPALQPFIALRQITTDYAHSPEQLTQAVAQFQRVYSSHLLGKKLPLDVASALTLNRTEIKEIVVLLPLTGRLATTGQSVKDGIMAAYYQQLTLSEQPNNLPKLRFVDTSNTDAATLVSAIGDAKFIIGPLLKETVEQLIPQLPIDVNILALNRPDTPLVANANLSSESSELTLNNNINYFALAPEDEANQLAQYIYDKGYRAPVVVSAQSSLYQRMNNAFQARWNTLHEQDEHGQHATTTVVFNDSTSLRDGITQALDVAQSNKRINQIEYMVNETVYNMPRSRRDIDVIVAFASPQDTELLNPIIEASLNPLNSTPVPVFATSRSLDYDSGKNQWRDLQNVRFLDMPWMMPDHPWQTLANETSQIWPDRTTMQNRLFAFGADAYALLPNLGVMNVLSYVTYDGLTGTLALNNNREIERSQPQAIIRNEQVQRLTE